MKYFFWDNTLNCMKYDAIARNCYHLFYDKTKIYPMAPELTKTFDV